MKPVAAALTVATLTVAVLILAAYGWYSFVGWTPFQYHTGDSPSWAASGQADVSKLRFRRCVYTVARADGVTRSLDVAPVLNGMARAYKGGAANPAKLTLTGPLNPFSFVIVGFNDKQTVSDPTTALWTTATVSLGGASRTV